MKGLFIQTGRGKLFMINGYTFARRFNNLYYCSKRGFGCMCSIKIGEDEVSVTRFTGEHNHPPPDYTNTTKGYIKLSK